MAIYYVDLEKTQLSTDSVTGDTIVSVDDASFISSGDDLKIGAEIYTVDSVSANDITLTSATTADYTTGTTVEIDDTNLDGLTPQTAKRSTIFIDGADVNNVNTVWVRRKTGYTLTANSPLVSYCHIIFWPSEGQYMYEERPQEGIDAGWDTDVDNSGIDLQSHIIYHNNGSNNTDMLYGNVKLIYANNTDSTPAFIIKGGNLEFRNSKIECNRTHNYRGPLVRNEHSGTRHVMFRDCEIDIPNTSIMSVYDSHDHNHIRYADFYNTTVRGQAIFVTHCTSTNKYQGWNIVNSENSEFYLTATMIAQGGYRSYINGYNKFVLSNTIVRSQMMLSNRTTDSYWGMSPLSIDISNCDIETTSTSAMFYFYHRNSHGHDSNGYEKWKIRNSRIVSAGKLFYFYRPDAKLIRQYGTIDIRGCEIDIEDTFLHMQNLSNWGRFIFTRNKIIRCGRLIYSTANPDSESLISIRDGHFNNSLIYGGNKYNVSLSNVSIDGWITESNVYYENVDAVSVECRGALGYGVYRFLNSDINTVTEADPINNTASAVFKGCNIDSVGGNIAGAVANQVTFIDSNIDGNLFGEFNSWRTVHNSTVNSVSVPYYDSSILTRKEISPIFRIGGSNGTVKLTHLQSSEIAILEMKGITGELSAGATKVVLYFASTISEAYMDNIEVVARYFDSAGDSRYVSFYISVDQSSSWDGIQDGSTLYKASAELVGINIPIGDDRRVIVEFRANIEPDDIDKVAYIDTDLKSE